jgi:asparagine synthetase B (glutamine-hydrolysing)
METRQFDFVDLGTGSTAFAAAIRAAELAKTVAMMEHRTPERREKYVAHTVAIRNAREVIRDLSPDKQGFELRLQEGI